MSAGPWTGPLMAAISKSIDDANRDRMATLSREDLEAQLLGWLRIAKGIEERGEAIDAWIGFTGANPRKGVTCGMEDVVKELLDEAATALLALEHFNGNDGYSTMDMFTDHIGYLADRIGLAVPLLDSEDQ